MALILHCLLIDVLFIYLFIYLFITLFIVDHNIVIKSNLPLAFNNIILYLHIRIYIHTYAHAHTYTHTYTHMHTHLCMSAYIYIYIYIIYTYMYIYEIMKTMCLSGYNQNGFLATRILGLRMYSYIYSLWMVLDGKPSQECPINSGDPEGSIFGRTPFLLHINDLSNDVIYYIDIWLMILLSTLSLIGLRIWGNSKSWLMNLCLTKRHCKEDQKMAC